MDQELGPSNGRICAPASVRCTVPGLVTVTIRECLTAAQMETQESKSQTARIRLLVYEVASELATAATIIIASGSSTGQLKASSGAQTCDPSWILDLDDSTVRSRLHVGSELPEPERVVVISDLLRAQDHMTQPLPFAAVFLNIGHSDQGRYETLRDRNE
ncbi:hypothetical protein CONLIGDRAFT_643621 [Coniochaeta ligniaria NRRL 30616]|uniref:Uncharacterized protein n=1 Tax=Coniochaeta ligniaria NRRL 30616 TaxID=1408157 RepID=A0A1J7IPI6_9PEZI|nr:hypothetical protein CONLIGDRAFT_643621 [Coniochaeta ligniaria NRRL 30616]